MELVNIKGVTYEIRERKGSKNLTLKPVSIPVALIIDVVNPNQKISIGEFKSDEQIERCLESVGI